MRLYVGSLPYQTIDQDLLDLFGQIGEVTQATVITDRETGRSKGFGFVEMNNTEEAQSSIAQLNGTVLEGRTITVNEARERPAAGNRGFQGRERRSYGGGRY